MDGVEVPFERMSAEALRGVIEEFVTREGTDYGGAEYSLAAKVAAVEAQIRRREVLILFSPRDETIQLVARDDLKKPSLTKG